MSSPESNDSRSARRVKQGSRCSIPDDLVINILIRLPVEDIIRCRRICRGARDLISTQDFANAYPRSKGPVILADALDDRTFGSKKILLSRWWVPGLTRSKVRLLDEYSRRFSRYAPHCSGDGLLVLKSEYNLRKYIVFNPVCGKKVTMVFPRRLFGRTDALAIYFHPTLKEYCILWAVYWPSYWRPDYDPDEKGVQYMILVLGANPCWRKIRNPWIRNVKNPYKPVVLLGRYLYWLVKPVAMKGDEYCGKFAIMEFDILSEELKVMPSPVLHVVKCHGDYRDLLNNENISLLDVSGLLSLILISPIECRVYQWTLISRVEELWKDSIYTVIKLHNELSHSLRPVALMDDRLLIESFRILVVNLKQGALKKLDWHFHSFSTFLPHVISLASLSNCKSKLIIEEKDEEITVEAKDEEAVASRKDLEDGAVANIFWKPGNAKKRSSLVVSRIKKFDQCAEKD